MMPQNFVVFRIIQNIIFCVQQSKVIYTDLKQFNGAYMMGEIYYMGELSLQGCSLYITLAWCYIQITYMGGETSGKGEGKKRRDLIKE